MVRRLVVALVAVAVILRTLAILVVRIQGGMVLLLVVAVVLEPLTAVSLVHRLGRLGLGPLCWSRVSCWVLVDAAVGAHSSPGLERKRRSGFNRAPTFVPS